MEELIKRNVTTIVNLEYLGIRIEDVKEEDFKTVYYYSVPESSTLEVENKELNSRIKTANDLKRLAKEAIVNMLLDNCLKEFGEDADKFVSDVKNNTSDYFKFYAKVRSGEIWNKELAAQRMKELEKEFEKLCEYEEI